MNKNKINPRKIPATMADIKRAKKEAQDMAISFAWAIMFTALRDKEGWGKTRLQRLWNEVNALSDSIAAGYVNVTDLMYALKKEAGIELR